MNKFWIGLLVGVAAVIVLLFGAAFVVGGSRLRGATQWGWGMPMWGSGCLGRYQPDWRNQPQRFSWMPGMGMMGRYSTRRTPGLSPDRFTGERISIQEALELAQSFAANYGDDLAVAEVMEFNAHFYAVITEENGKAAFEILIDPYRGRITPEPGPNMMWNLKYGHMALPGEARRDNPILMDEAQRIAQDYLDQWQPSATVSDHGFDFYGYYTFDYEVAGKVAGMLSVNGFDGSVWVHTWHDEFIQELEVEE